MIKNLKLIIYDLDGVLIDSREAICKIFNRVLNEVGEKSHPEDNIKDMIGEPLSDMFRKVLPKEKHNLIDRCANSYIEIYKQTALNSTRLLDGVADTAAYFKSKGIRQSVATTKSSEEADIILRGLNVRQHFDLLLGFTDVKNPKPDPEIIHQTLQKLNAQKDSAVMVGDTASDIEAGKGAGIHTIGITTGTHSRERLSQAKPNYVIGHIRELKDVIVV